MIGAEDRAIGAVAIDDIDLETPRRERIDTVRRFDPVQADLGQRWLILAR